MALGSLNRKEEQEEEDEDNDDDWYSDQDLFYQYFIFFTILTPRNDGQMLYF